MIGNALRRMVKTGLAAFALSALAALPVLAQNAVIRGTVTSSDRKEPIAGVNVTITDLSISVFTSDRGQFVITVPSARIPAQPVPIVARAIGFKAVSKGTLIRAGEMTVDYVLQTDINRLEEVVVTGVMEGTERGKVPFAVARLTAEDLPVPSLDPIRALMGKMPGVRIAQTSGFPGSVPEILIRGPTSINANNRGQGPLIIVDDAIMNVGNLDELGGLDIESVEVVKGAAGASLYGTRAANGVITIRTKRGLTGSDGVKFNVRTEYGFSDLNSTDWGQPVNHPLQLDETGKRFCVVVSNQQPCARTYDWMTEILRINNVNADSTRVQQSTVYNTPGATDLRNIFQAQIWPDRYYNTLVQVSARNPTILTAVDATGKIGNVSFYTSASYTDEAGAIRGLNGVQNRRARLNLDYNVRSDLKVSFSTAYDNQKLDNRGLGFGSFLRGAPPGTDYLAIDTLGRYLFRAGGTGFRPTGNGSGAPLYNTRPGRVADQRSNRFLGSVTTKYFPADWVTFEGTFAYDYRGRVSNSISPKGSRSTSALSATTNGGSMAFGNNKLESINGSLTATFRSKLATDLNGKMSFRGIYDDQTSETNNSGGQIFRVKDIFTTTNTTTNKTSTSTANTTKNIGVFAGMTLDYKDRYVLEGSFRYDGSSRFGSGHRWSPFGRISGVWQVSHEPFWKVPFMDEFRLRASRGTAGTTPQFDAQYEVYTVGTNTISLDQAGNSQLRPETTTEIELGTDFTLFRRLGFEITYAYGKTKDQILPVSTAAALGFTSQWQNAGTLSNRTWEVSLNLPVVNSKSLYWQMRGTWDRTRTQIDTLFVPDFIYSGGTGQGTGSFFLISDEKRRYCDPGEVGHYPGEDNTKCKGAQLNRYGNIYGRTFFKACSQLPSSIRTDCGEGKAYQVNDKGYVVWVGAGNSWKDGITRNLWQTTLRDVDNPWGVTIAWGHPIVDRPLTGQVGSPNGFQNIIGNTLPKFRFTFSNDIQYKKLTLYALLDGTIGHYINNQGEQWGLLDVSSANFDMANQSVETAKPVGYHWRVGPPEGVGTGGFYDVLGPNNYTTELGSYAKLREVSLTYKLGRLGGVGDWTVGLVGRNLATFTGYTGYDPETGVSGGNTGSGLINQTDAFDFPTLRTFTFSLSTRF